MSKGSNMHFRPILFLFLLYLCDADRTYTLSYGSPRVKRSALFQDAVGGGTPGTDFPVLNKVPRTDFSCVGRIPGYYANEKHGCQVFHVCHSDRRKDSFLCPNGTIFNQQRLICDWWYNVDCSTSKQHESVNAGIGRSSEEDIDEFDKNLHSREHSNVQQQRFNQVHKPSFPDQQQSRLPKKFDQRQQQSTFFQQPPNPPSVQQPILKPPSLSHHPKLQSSIPLHQTPHSTNRQVPQANFFQQIPFQQGPASPRELPTSPQLDSRLQVPHQQTHFSNNPQQQQSIFSDQQPRKSTISHHPPTIPIVSQQRTSFPDKKQILFPPQHQQEISNQPILKPQISQQRTPISNNQQTFSQLPQSASHLPAKRPTVKHRFTGGHHTLPRQGRVSQVQQRINNNDSPFNSRNQLSLRTQQKNIHQQIHNLKKIPESQDFRNQHSQGHANQELSKPVQKNEGNTLKHFKQNTLTGHRPLQNRSRKPKKTIKGLSELSLPQKQSHTEHSKHKVSKITPSTNTQNFKQNAIVNKTPHPRRPSTRRRPKVNNQFRQNLGIPVRRKNIGQKNRKTAHKPSHPTTQSGAVFIQRPETSLSANRLHHSDFTPTTVSPTTTTSLPITTARPRKQSNRKSIRLGSKEMANFRQRFKQRRKNGRRVKKIRQQSFRKIRPVTPRPLVKPAFRNVISSPRKFGKPSGQVLESVKEAFIKPTTIRPGPLFLRKNEPEITTRRPQLPEVLRFKNNKSVVTQKIDTQTGLGAGIRVGRISSDDIRNKIRSPFILPRPKKPVFGARTQKRKRPNFAVISKKTLKLPTDSAPNPATSSKFHSSAKTIAHQLPVQIPKSHAERVVITKRPLERPLHFNDDLDDDLEDLFDDDRFDPFDNDGDDLFDDDMDDFFDDDRDDQFDDLEDHLEKINAFNNIKLSHPLINGQVFRKFDIDRVDNKRFDDDRFDDDRFDDDRFDDDRFDDRFDDDRFDDDRFDDDRFDDDRFDDDRFDDDRFEDNRFDDNRFDDDRFDDDRFDDDRFDDDRFDDDRFDDDRFDDDRIFISNSERNRLLRVNLDDRLERFGNRGNFNFGRSARGSGPSVLDTEKSPSQKDATVFIVDPPSEKQLPPPPL